MLTFASVCAAAKLLHYDGAEAINKALGLVGRETATAMLVQQQLQHINKESFSVSGKVKADIAKVLVDFKLPDHNFENIFETAKYFFIQGTDGFNQRPASISDEMAGAMLVSYLTSILNGHRFPIHAATEQVIQVILDTREIKIPFTQE